MFKIYYSDETEMFDEINAGTIIGVYLFDTNVKSPVGNYIMELIGYKVTNNTLDVAEYMQKNIIGEFLHMHKLDLTRTEVSNNELSHILANLPCTFDMGNWNYDGSVKKYILDNEYVDFSALDEDLMQFSVFSKYRKVFTDQ